MGAFLRKVAVATFATLCSAIALAQGTGPLPGGGAGTYGPPISSVTGHLTVGNAAAPSVANCGTGATVVGTDSAILLNSGTSSNSSCRITFRTPWNSRPICSVDNQTAAAQATFVVDQFGVGITGVADSSIYNVICNGQPGG